MKRPDVPTVLAAFLLAVVAAAAAGAQSAPPPAQTPPPAPATAPKPQTPAPRQAAAAPPQAAARVSATVFVTDQSGAEVPDVRVTMTGPVPREGTTGRDGTLKLQGLRPGTYRLRFQATDFITFEREATLKAGPPTEIEVALNRDAPKPRVVEPEPAPAAPPSAPVRAGLAPDPSASVEFVALPDWIERNLIGRSDTVKESTIGRTPVATATVLQVREPLKDRSRADADEMLYVIAGQGVLKSKGRELALDAGALVVVPRGVGYSIERRGRNPLIALSVVGR
jgi:mannose-6-phosphate isomerase-like protein (cupin superfamily)